MRPYALAFGIFTATAGAGCSGETTGDDAGSGGAQGGASGQGGSTMGGTSGTGVTGGSAGTAPSSGGTGATSTGGAGGGGSGAAGSGGTGAAAFTKSGVCGQRGESTVNASSTFAGFEEFYMVSEEAVDDGRLDEYICAIRFDVTRVGNAPAGCLDEEGMPCAWTHLVEFSNPTVVTDVDGVCANSQIAQNAAWIAGIDGSQAAYGFVSEYSGHASTIMKLDAARSAWGAFGNATWDEMSGEFRFDRRNGVCRY